MTTSYTVECRIPRICVFITDKHCDSFRSGREDPRPTLPAGTYSFSSRPETETALIKMKTRLTQHQQGFESSFDWIHIGHLLVFPSWTASRAVGWWGNAASLPCFLALATLTWTRPIQQAPSWCRDHRSARPLCTAEGMLANSSKSWDLHNEKQKIMQFYY